MKVLNLGDYLREESLPDVEGSSRFPTTYEDFRSPRSPPPDDFSSSSPSSLAAQAIRASSAHRDSSLSSAYGESAISSPAAAAAAQRDSNRQRFEPSRQMQDSSPYEYTSIKNLNEPKGFWGVLARKAKTILDEDNSSQHVETSGRTRPQMLDTSDGQYYQSYRSSDSHRKLESPKLQKGLDAITSSLNYIGGTIGKSLEEGLTRVEHRTADIISDARKLHIRRKGSGTSDMQNSSTDPMPIISQMQTDYETQLKASRDVANAMAAKAKLLLRELKTVKADLAFAKERCAQLEEENKILRESREKGDNPEDDDLIRLQLETLLAEKARLAHENSVFARENRFLREIVEYHQLTMQDVVYLDEGHEEVTEVSPIHLPPKPPTPSPKENPTSVKSPSPPPPPATEPQMHLQIPPALAEAVPLQVPRDALESPQSPTPVVVVVAAAVEGDTA
ncbi:hypothetical protein QJS04_geneDACA022651 [Acorus gramineus]|uniref:Uncharacterized protein n=1 Tax=Acorus gramineus TaxID=55184 RepID=A0AAV9B6A0_ACOGR|nr:hypothetical protein QJS04_geneDACA022651 [Acorus gramineus]